MKLPFRRNNSDNPVLMRDLEALADAYRDGAPPPRPHEENVAKPTAEATGIERILSEDGYVRNFVRTVVHVRRYLPFYGVGTALLLVFALVAPINEGSDTEFASDVVSQAPDAEETVDAADGDSAATADAMTPSFSGDAIDFGQRADDSTASGDFGSSFSPEPSFGEDYPTFSSPQAPQPLRIAASGYASVSGGTPFEVEPADGALPVSAGAGKPGRISFVKLAGDGEKLRLREVSGGVGGAGASVRACLITEDWEPERGVPMSEAPAYDAEHCSTGVRSSDRIWVFDLLVFADSTGYGLALVPGPGTAPPTFDIAFEPKALPSSTTAEG